MSKKTNKSLWDKTFGNSLKKDYKQMYLKTLKAIEGKTYIDISIVALGYFISIIEMYYGNFIRGLITLGLFSVIGFLGAWTLTKIEKKQKQEKQ